MKNIILFDMDGTLTEPRKLIKDNMVNTLIRITELGHDVGSVTGSPPSYVNEQLEPLIHDGGFNFDSYHGWNLVSHTEFLGSDSCDYGFCYLASCI